MRRFHRELPDTKKRKTRAREKRANFSRFSKKGRKMVLDPDKQCKWRRCATEITERNVGL